MVWDLDERYSYFTLQLIMNQDIGEKKNQLKTYETKEYVGSIKMWHDESGLLGFEQNIFFSTYLAFCMQNYLCVHSPVSAWYIQASTASAPVGQLHLWGKCIAWRDIFDS